jgi:hypothetical protein
VQNNLLSTNKPNNQQTIQRTWATAKTKNKTPRGNPILTFKNIMSGIVIFIALGELIITLIQDLCRYRKSD